MYGVMYLEGDSKSTLKYSMLYLDSDMLFRIRYYIRIQILYLVRTDVPNCPLGSNLSIYLSVLGLNYSFTESEHS